LETAVFTLFLILMLVWFVLIVVLAAWTLWYQNYIYTEPATGILWRGPAAGSAVMLVLFLWVVMDYRSPGRYRPIYEFSATETPKPFPELRVPRDTGEEQVFKLLSRGGRPEYHLGGLSTGQPLPSRPQKVIVIENGERVVFEPERDEKGNFKSRKSGGTEEPLRYLDPRGRVMYEGQLGQLTTFRRGWLFGNLFVNVLLLAAWFLSLWLLLRFQWPAALLQAFVFWLVALLFVLPPVLTRAEDVAKQRAAQRAGPVEPPAP
jgi:hypothetical protein